MRPIAFRCKKCEYIFAPIKRPESYIRRGREVFKIRCPRCRARGNKLIKVTIQNIDIIFDYYKNEPWDLETMEVALTIREYGSEIIRIAERIRELRPDEPDGAPGCWDGYDGKNHCKKKCPEIHGKEIQKSCIARRKWDDQWNP
jgi:rubredoxin